jgi:predicted nucleic acid-binding protein
LNLVLDSYAWIELFLGGEKGEKVKQLISDADEVRTPSIVLAEVSRKYHRENVDEKRIKSRLETISSTSILTSVDTLVALKAGRAYLELAEKAKQERRRPPSLFDAIVLATARQHDSKVLTGDEHFKSFPETIII